MTVAGARVHAPGERVPSAHDIAEAVLGSPPARVSDAERAARFRVIVEEHYQVVWRFLRGLGVPAAAVDDAAQQVFVATWRHIDSVERGSERAFLFATARGTAANVRRGVGRSREVLDGGTLARTCDDAPTPEERVRSSQARAVLDRLLDQLSDDVRDVFVLYELEEMTMAAIARDLGLPPGTVASRLRRAREEFEAAVTRFRARTERP